MRSILVLILISSAAGAGAAELPTGTELHSLPFNVSLVPPLSVNALYRFRSVNAFSLDLLLGNSAALHGVEISGLGSRNGEVRGLQVAGLGNWVDAGAYGQSGDARALQIAGLTAFIDKEPQKIDPAGYGWKIGSDVRLWPGFLAGLRLF